MLALLALAGLVTAASVVVDVATRTPPAPPDGLRFVQAGDVRTRFLAWGDHGSPVVLVPGAFETADSFTQLGEVLGEDHRVFAFDLTGQGYSDAVAPFDVDHDARQTVAFAAALGLTGSDAPVLVGHSSGAAVVGLAALAAPLDVAGVVFLDGDALPLDVGGGPRLLVDPYKTSLVRLALRSDSLIRRLYASQCGPTCAPLDAAGVDRWRRPLQQGGTERALLANATRGVIPAMSSEQLDALRRSDVPRLVVWGRDDVDGAYTPESPASTARAIGAPPPVVVPGRHLTMISSPREVAAAIRPLLRRGSGLRR
ncbi:Pimeloyl-ACP methyl ester carboxylesterase [Microlunatus flavus]|uniref:Pimeloyl-ACP methyl ester carboxylesterase n=1 Tax=Microlunatus flavus TaxID=1036181 RepID=A0A1H9EWQ6_9ACTN|nr:Pimeloyl-ACP methyl ester carboxylesterase [Microlunatus flavus]